jgi:hypothetical protein
MLGFDVGTRLLFDNPPHLHLTIGGEWHLPSVVGTSIRYNRNFWSTRFTISLVKRSYRIE